eukprot:c18988_g1_i1.p2 GENE.c18988_g1_i1~~c18988_g1_i1.p2  ORF type:complete len:173 (+),score=44.61 c18988_g1_i1:117-635(+)
MEAHALLLKHGFNVCSYGTNSKIRLPGPTADRPNVFEFGTSYSTMLKQLSSENADLYIQNGVLDMLERNMAIKPAPEKFQYEKRRDWALVVTFDDRVFETVDDDLKRNGKTGQEVWVVNLPIKDNREEAAIGALICLQLCLRLEEVTKNDWESVIKQFQSEHELSGSFTCVR